MNIITVILIIVASLFLAAYFTKRRFGVLGLALCAGSVLSAMWAADVTPFIRDVTGIRLLAPPLASVVAVCMVLLPAILLFFSGPTYHKKWQRIIGAAAFSVLATTLALPYIGGGLSLDAASKDAYDLLLMNRDVIVTGAIAYALIDLLTLKTPKKSEE